MKRGLGQHFLKDKSVLKKIADLLEINYADVVIEIGPGHGELTKYLLDAGPKKVIAVEKDKQLVSGIKDTVYSDKLDVIEGDILKVLPGLSQKSQTNSYKLTGNIPYYITGYLLRTVGGLENKPELIVFTVQQEVAERICAEPPKMNLLAAAVQFWSEPKLMFSIKKSNFSPPPKVNSAVIKLTPKRINKKLVEKYYELIKFMFKQPRKTVLNNLAAGLKLPKEEIVKTLAKQCIRPDLRPQNLTVRDLTALSNVFRAKK